MTGGEDKPWKNQTERKAYFIERKNNNNAKKRSSYRQGHWQWTGSSPPTQPWPFPGYAYPPGQFQPFSTNHWQPWPPHPPTHPMGQSQTPGWNHGQASSTQGTSQPTMQPQPRVLSQEQAIHEFHRLHQFNSEQRLREREREREQSLREQEQSFNQLQSLITGQPVAPSEHMHPVNQMPNHPPQYQHCPVPDPDDPFFPPQDMQHAFNVGQALGAFGIIPMSQTSQTPASKNPFKPDSARCEEVDDTSMSTCSVPESSETPLSSVATIDKFPEPDRKRKSETEIVETTKRTRVESTAEPEAPTASNKDLVQMDTELDQPHEIELVLPQALPNPSADDVLIDQHQCSSHPDFKSPTAAAVDNAEAETTLEILSWDDAPIDPHQDSSHPDSKSPTVLAVDHASAETTPETPYLFSLANRQLHPEVLLEQEHAEAEKTFREYGSDFVDLGKHARYPCTIFLPELSHFRGQHWYSAGNFIMYRCAMNVPSNFIFVTPLEMRDQQTIDTTTTDIVYVHHEDRNHWIMVHVDIQKWKVTYYNSMLANHPPELQEQKTKRWYDWTVLDMGRRQRSETVTLPIEQPEMACKFTIHQKDSHSCGPLIMREVEKLMNLPVEDDMEDPLLIRLRHLITIHRKMKHRIVSEAPDDPAEVYGPAYLAQVNAQLETWTANAKSVQESPELPCGLLPPKTSESVCEDNPSLPGPLQSSVDEPLFLEMSASQTPTPGLQNDNDHSGEVQSPFLGSSQHILFKDQPATQSEGKTNVDIYRWGAPRPDDKTLQSLTVDQRKQALKTLSLSQLRAMCRMAGGLSKADLVDRIAMMTDKPLPEACHFNFLLSSVYVNQSHDEICREHRPVLENELHRLGVCVSKGRRNSTLADSIINFIKSKGLGHEPMRMIKKLGTEPARIQALPPLNTVELRVEALNADIKNIGEGGRGPFNIPISTATPTCVMIISRLSAGETPRQLRKHQIEHAVMEHSLKNKRIFTGLEGANIVHYYFWHQQLRVPIPRRPPRIASKQHLESDQGKFIQRLRELENGSRVVIACLGLDGISCDEVGWRDFIKYYQTEKGLDLHLAISEDQDQWRRCEPKWSEEDWLGPFSTRYWTCIKMNELFEDIRLCKQLRDQWTQCGDRRVKLSESFLMQDRPGTGRNGPKQRPSEMIL